MFCVYWKCIGLVLTFFFFPPNFLHTNGLCPSASIAFAWVDNKRTGCLSCHTAIHPMSCFFVWLFAKRAFGTYFLFPFSVPVAMVPRSNKSVNKGTEVKKLSTVTMWPRLSNSYRRFVTTPIACRPSPFPLHGRCSSSEQGRPLSLEESYSSSLCRFDVLP
jgi:hypothetical protein